jgi:hypothetical protein
VSLHDWSTAGPHVSARPVAGHALLGWGRTPSLRDNPEGSIRRVL